MQRSTFASILAAAAMAAAVALLLSPQLHSRSASQATPAFAHTGVPRGATIRIRSIDPEDSSAIAPSVPALTPMLP